MNVKDTHPSVHDSLPYRGRFGETRPDPLSALALPPDPMPARQRLRPLKAWRYVGVYGPDVMLCIGAVRIGRARQAFWAVWDRSTRRLHERTALGRGAVTLEPGRAKVTDRAVQIDLELDETSGVETVCPSGDSYAWTRKQGGIRAHGTLAIAGEPRILDARAVIDDTAAYYARHTQWHWSAGVGVAIDGRPVAWNLVAGVNDPPGGSERSVWLDGEPVEVGSSVFAEDLSSVGDLRFVSEAVRESNDNLLLVRSRYRQPFGTFSGVLPNGVALAEGYGVMEEHDVYW
ncbi:MAG TPA: DUF2804 family protein [Solirubrobacteraceae bacterium]|nr:DUF2804 family protein [Solirubrobacteraceae bacterium]